MGANSYVCKSCSGKIGRGILFGPTILNIVKWPITILNIRTEEDPNNANKKSIFKTCHPLTNAQVNDAHDTDKVMFTYILIEYSDIYWKPSRGLWQYYRDEGTLNNDGDINDFPVNNSNNHNST